MQAIEFSTEEIAALREEMFRGFTDSQIALCLAECKRRNLVPGQHIHFSLRSSKEYDPDLKTSKFVKKIVRITTIDAMRLIAQRTGEYEGQGAAVFYYLDADGEPTITSKIPLAAKGQINVPREPWAVSIPVYRRGLREPVEVVARFEAYAQTRKTDNGTILTEVWTKRGPEMTLKCSVVAALRAAFPEELGQLYIKEEFDKDEDSSVVSEPTPEPVVVSPAPTPLVVPIVNSALVEGTSDARPNETKPKRETKKKVEEPAPEPTLEYVQKTDTSITDDDLPAEMFDEPAASAPVERVYTPEEWKGFVDELRSYTRIDRTQLKSFILREGGLPPTGDPKKVSYEGYKRALEKLKEAQAAKDKGKADAFDKLLF